MTDNEIVRDHNSINRIAFFKKRAKDFFADYENPTGSEDKLEICLIRDGCRAVSQAEEIINRLQADKEALIAGQETLQKALAEKAAEVEELTGNLKFVRGTVERQKAEIEKLKEASEEAVSCFHRMESLYNIKCMELKVAKAEAIKEFAERLKAKPIKCSYPLLWLSTKDEITDCFNDIMMQFKEAIDTLAKEMVGDTK